jgi:PKD repeat protein
LPETPLTGQDEFDFVFINSSETEADTDNQFIMINIPCSSGVQFIDNISQQGVYNVVWDFGDGNTQSGTSVIHTYTRPGQYVVTKTITFCQES